MDAGAYLDRLGVERPAEPTLDALARLQVAHLLAVPFENLDIVAGRRISLDPQALFDKIVTRRRGGFCYELNGLFALLLGRLGYAVTLLSARTVGVQGALGPEFDHLVLRVDLDGDPWLADVGFGDSFRTPIPLAPGEHRDSLDRAYRLEERDGEWDLLEHLDPAAEAWTVAPGLDESVEWRIQHRFTLRPHMLEDFAGACRWQETESPFFTGHRFCTIATPDGRATLMDDRLIVTSPGAREERPVAEDEVPALLRELFGVEPEPATRP